MNMRYLICLAVMTTLLHSMEPDEQLYSQSKQDDTVESLEQLTARLKIVENKALDLATLVLLEQERHQESTQNLTNQLAIMQQDYSVMNQRYKRCKKSLADLLNLVQHISILLDASPSVPQAPVSPRKKIFTRSRKTQPAPSGDTLVDTRDYRDVL